MDCDGTEMTPDVPSPDAISPAIRRSTRASAKIEGREVPEGYARSSAVQAYLDKLKRTQTQRDADADLDGPEQSVSGGI